MADRSHLLIKLFLYYCFPFPLCVALDSRLLKFSNPLDAMWLLSFFAPSSRCYGFGLQYVTMTIPSHTQVHVGLRLIMRVFVSFV